MVSATVVGCMNEYGRNERVFCGSAVGAGTGVLMGGGAIGEPEGVIAGVIIGDNIGRDRRSYRCCRGCGCDGNRAFDDRSCIAC